MEALIGAHVMANQESEATYGFLERVGILPKPIGEADADPDICQPPEATGMARWAASKHVLSILSRT